MAQFQKGDLVTVRNGPQKKYVGQADLGGMDPQFAFDRSGTDDHERIPGAAKRIEQDMEALVVSEHSHEKEKAFADLRFSFSPIGPGRNRDSRTVEADRDHLGLVEVAAEDVAGLDVVL